MTNILTLSEQQKLQILEYKALEDLKSAKPYRLSAYREIMRKKVWGDIFAN